VADSSTKRGKELSWVEIKRERERERERESEVEKREKRSVISVTRTQSGSFGPDCCWGNNLTKLKKGVEIETERERKERERVKKSAGSTVGK
jgi:hypothetical protein